MSASAQSITVYVVLAAAVVYALYCAWAAIRSKSGCACPGGGCHTPDARLRTKRHVLTPLRVDELPRDSSSRRSTPQV